MRIVVAFLLLMICLEAHAQYAGPAVEACRAYAKKEALKFNAGAREVVFDRDQALVIERYTRKLGSQFVSSVLTGNGAVVLESAPSAELSFICLLASEKHPVFFYWLPRQDVSAAVQCTRNPSQRATPRLCLEYLMQVAEADLAQLYALRFQEARERDANTGGGNEDAVAAYRKSNDEWRQYRNAECARKRDHAPPDFAPGDYQLACAIDLTRRRALDMR
jgi:uncharacterized protein YecT (DUF1311 family)